MRFDAPPELNTATFTTFVRSNCWRCHILPREPLETSRPFDCPFCVALFEIASYGTEALSPKNTRLAHQAGAGLSDRGLALPRFCHMFISKPRRRSPQHATISKEA